MEGAAPAAAIGTSRDFTPGTNLYRARQLHDLGIAYGQKYRRTRVLGDITKAIQILQECLDLTPYDHIDRAGRLHDIGIGYADRYRILRALDDLEASIQNIQESLAITPHDSPHRARRLQDFGLVYKDKFNRTRAPDDLEISIRQYQEALDLTPQNSPDRARRLHDLGVVYRDRFNLTESLNDIETSIQLCQEALILTPQNKPDQIGQRQDPTFHAARTQVDPFKLPAVVKHETDPKHQQVEASISSIASPQLSAQVFSVGPSQIPSITTRSDDLSSKDKEQTLHDDTSSVYSSESHIPEASKKGSIEVLAEILAQRILSSKAPRAEKYKIVTKLPDLLKAFAVRLGYDNSDNNKMYLDTMVFVRKHRQKITESIAVQLKDHDDMYEVDQIQKPNVNVPEMSLNDRMHHWNVTESENNKEEWEDIEWPPEITPSERENNDLEAYTKLVLESSHLDWLLRKLDRELEFEVLGREHMNKIARFIIAQHAGNERLVRRRRPETLRLAFTFMWIQLIFNSSVEKLWARGYDKDDIVSVATLDQALVLTGTASDAVATTIGEYLNMIWFGRGTHVIDLIKEALLSPGITKEKRSDDVELTACMQESQVSIECKGELYAIAEVAEILGWLASVFSPSSGEGNHLIGPSISWIEKDEAKSFDNYTHYHIGSSSQRVEDEPSSGCWYGMFEHVAIIEGYPIPRRNGTGIGLELSLYMIAKLLRTNHTTIRNGSLAIREYSHALFPTSRSDNIIRWHYIYDADGANMPYWKAHSRSVHNLLTSDLPHHKHFVGWCSKANTIAGAPGDHYDVKRSDLPIPSAGLLLDSFNITGSQFIGGQVNIKFGIRRPALHIAADGFAQKIIALRQHYVVLWDHEDKRGWLVDGLSALLHLLRTSLLASSKDNFNQDLFCLDLNEDVDEPDGTYPDAALRFFFQNKGLHPNMKLKIYPGEDEKNGYLILDQVKHICAVLQDIIDQQHKIATKDGVAFTTSLRQNLLGWDFVNIATDHDFYEPYSVNLSYRGAAWVDLIRSIRAVVLFGRGFGEIIQPAKTDSEALCEHWSKLPKHEYYLATYASTLNSIIKRYGKSDTTHTKLTNDLVWHSPSTAFGFCSCQRPSSQGKHSDFTQVIWPVRLQNLLPKTIPTSLNIDGAIIFGQNKRFPWYWPNKGDPCKKKPSPSSPVIVSRDTDGNSSEATLALRSTPSSSVGISKETSQTSTDFENDSLQQSSQGTPQTGVDSMKHSGQQTSRLQRLAVAVHMKPKPKPPPSR